MRPPEHTDDPADAKSNTGRDVIYRDSAISALDVRRAADALLRQGIKPSVAAVRDQLGGGSPNTLTPLVSKYWETLGQRLGAGPESLERVPESLARVTELFWRRALEEARERLKTLAEPGASASQLLPLQEQVMKLSLALAEARAREGEQLNYSASLSKERETLRTERGSLLALLKSTQALLRQQNARVAVLEGARRKELLATARPSNRTGANKTKSSDHSSRHRHARSKPATRKKGNARKPK